MRRVASQRSSPQPHLLRHGSCFGYLFDFKKGTCMARLNFSRLFLASVFVLGLTQPLVFPLQTLAQSKPSPETIAQEKLTQKRDIDQVFQRLITHYGMVDYKQFQFGFTLEEKRKEFYDLVDKGMLPDGYKNPNGVLSRIEAQQLIMALCASFKDGHFNCFRPSNAIWSTGVRGREIRGHLIVTELMPQIFNSMNNSTPLKVGDEIVSINGVPIEKLAEARKHNVQLATYPTRLRESMQSLLTFSESNFLPKQENEKVTIGFLSPGEMTPKTAYARWTKVGKGSNADQNNRSEKEQEEIYQRLQAWVDVDSKGSSIIMSNTQPKVKAKPVSQTEIRDYRYGNRGRVSYFRVGITSLIQKAGRGQITDVGAEINRRIKAGYYEKPGQPKPKVALKPIDRLEAYTITIDGINIGVLRIPDYHPATPQDFFREIDWLRLVIAYMNDTTDTMIIDQLHNGGGYVDYVALLAGLFANRGPLKTISSQIKLSESLLNTYNQDKNWDIYFSSNISNLQTNREYVQYLRDKYQEGLSTGIMMTPPIPSMATGPMLPNEVFGEVAPLGGVAYNKKVLILNDSESASGGDFFPAIMQSNGRAVVMGERSMGMGGSVMGGSAAQTSLELYMQTTISLARLHDGTYIENKGVIPDIRRDVRLTDILPQDNFTSYANDVLSTAINLAQNMPVEAIQQQMDRTRPLNPAVPGIKELAALKIKLNQIATNSSLGMADQLTQYNAYLAAYLKVLSENPLISVSLSLPFFDIHLPSQLTIRDEFLAAESMSGGVIERLMEIIKRWDIRDQLDPQPRNAVKRVTKMKDSIEKDWKAAMSNPKIVKQLVVLIQQLHRGPSFWLVPATRIKDHKPALVWFDKTSNPNYFNKNDLANFFNTLATTGAKVNLATNAVAERRVQSAQAAKVKQSASSGSKSMNSCEALFQ